MAIGIDFGVEGRRERLPRSGSDIGAASHRVQPIRGHACPLTPLGRGQLSQLLPPLHLAARVTSGAAQPPGLIGRGVGRSDIDKRGSCLAGRTVV
jgi:hypothetical protein